MNEYPTTLIEKLKLVEREMDVYRWYTEAGLGDAVREAIRRLTPIAMTRTEAYLFLRDHGYSMGDAYRLTEDEMIAVAEKIEREKEAGVG